MSGNLKIAVQFHVPSEFRCSDLKLFFTECANNGESTFYLFMFCIGHCNVYQYEVCWAMSEDSKLEGCVEDKMDVESENCFAENLLRCSLVKKDGKLNVVAKECYILPAPVLDIGGHGLDIFTVTEEGIFGFPSSTSIAGDIFNTSDEDIFSALLDENDDEFFTPQRKKPIILDKKFLKLRKCNITSLSSCSNKLVICIKDEIQYSWKIEVLQFKDMNKEELEPLVMFCTPNIQYIPAYTNLESDAFMDPFEDINISKSLDDYTPILKCVEVNNDPLANHSKGVLKKEIFVALFGGDTLLLNSPVIIVGTPDGRVLWWPFKKWPCGATEEPGYLCNLEQPVCNIIIGHIPSENAGKSIEEDDCLIIVGRLGKIIIITAKHSGKDAVVFSVKHLSSPVYSCVVYRTGLLHNSSDGQLWYSELKLKTAGSNDVEVKCHQLPFVGILDIYTYEQLCDDVMCLTADGSLSSFPKSIVLTSNYASSHVDAGELEDLLKSIYRCSDELQEKHLLSKKQQRVMTELAAASDLTFGVSKQVTVSCTVEEIKGQLDTYLLSVEYRNIEFLNLAPEWWHLVVTIQEEYSEKEPKAISKSCPLSQGTTIQLLFEVQLIGGSSVFTLPVKVQCGLQLIFPETFSSPEFCTVKSKLPIYIAIETVQIHELWFLTKPVSSSVIRPVKGASLYGKNTLEEAIWSIAKSRVTYGLHEDKKTIKVVKTDFPKRFPTEIQVSVFMSIATSILAKAGKAVENDADLSHNLLKFLVTNSKDAEILLVQDKLDACCLGEPVSFYVEKESDYLKIFISTEDMYLLSGLRRAVTGFLVEALSDDTLPSQNQVQVSKQCLACAQSILAEIHQCLSKEKESISDEEIKIYYQLRERISRNLPLL